jgi:hypothetical protein
MSKPKRTSKLPPEKAIYTKKPKKECCFCHFPLGDQELTIKEYQADDPKPLYSHVECYYEAVKNPKKGL